MTDVLGVADSEGTPIKIGDFVRRPTSRPSGPHGEWSVSQVILQAGFPVLSYCYSEKGKVLPTGYTRSFLSDLYSPKSLLWINPGHFDTPDEDGELTVLKPEEVDMALVEQEDLTPRKD